MASRSIDFGSPEDRDTGKKLAQNSNEMRAIRREESRFREQLLKFVKDAQLGSVKVGVGPVAVRTRQEGNEKLAENVMDLASAVNELGDGASDFSRKIFEELKELNKSALSGTVEEQLAMKEQLRSLSIMTDMLSDSREAESASKKLLKQLINKTEKGLKENTRTFDKLAEFSFRHLPAISGIVSGAFGNSPLAAMAVNYIGERLQKSREKKNEAKKKAAESFFEYSDEVSRMRVEKERELLEFIKKSHEERKRIAKEDSRDITDLFEAMEAVATESSSKSVSSEASVKTAAQAEKKVVREESGLPSGADPMDLFSYLGAGPETEERISEAQQKDLDEFAEGFAEGIAEALAEEFPDGIPESMVEKLEERFKDIGDAFEKEVEDRFAVKDKGPEADVPVSGLVEKIASPKSEELVEAVLGIRSDLADVKLMLSDLSGEERSREEWAYREELLETIRGVGKEKAGMPDSVSGKKVGEKGILGSILTALGIQGGAAGIMGALKGTGGKLLRGVVGSFTKIGPLLGRLASKIGIPLVLAGGFFSGFRAAWDKWEKTGKIGDALFDGVVQTGNKIVDLVSFGFLDLSKITEKLSSWKILDPIFSAVEKFMENNPMVILANQIEFWIKDYKGLATIHDKDKNIVRKIQENVQKFYASMIPNWVPDSVLPEAVVKHRRSMGASVGENSDIGGVRIIEGNAPRGSIIGPPGLVADPTPISRQPVTPSSSSPQRVQAESLVAPSFTQKAPSARSGKHSLTAEQVAYLEETDAMLGLPKGFSQAQIRVESAYNPQAVSHAGARGLAQVMPKTQSVLEGRFGRSLDPFNPEDSLAMHRELMRENMARFKNPDDAARAYNGGWNPSTWGNAETSAYAPKIRNAMNSLEPGTSPVLAEGGVEKEMSNGAAMNAEKRTQAAEKSEAARISNAVSSSKGGATVNQVNNSQTIVQRKSPRNEDVTIATTHKISLA